MARPTFPLAAAACVLSAAAAGCGAAAPSAPPKVQVTLTAPTDGATVGVSRISVLGTVSPGNALLRVSGRAIRVRHGSFQTPLILRRGLTRIRIDASAKGFASSSMIVSVRYLPQRLVGLGGPGGGRSAGPSAAPGSSAGGRRQGDLSPVAKAEAIDSCAAASEGRAALCACIIERMLQSGFNTTAEWEALVQGWRRSFLARGEITYPPVMRRAIVSCAATVG